MSRRPVVSRRVAANRRAAVLLAGFVVAVLSMLFALQAALGGGAGGPLITGAASAGAPRPAATHAWLVRPGDTLWSIAAAVHPHGDVRPLVDRLSAQVGGRPLMVDQRLTLP
ncbi:MAG: LysM peptidoglycan-binding domain-containing protein [Actinomycetota bacterium]|nr:LysM peptidoglycan-binding domain-containing protein [Actinomycetota bacterium]